MTPILSGVRNRFRAVGGRHDAGHIHDRRLIEMLDGVGAADDQGHLAACRDCAERLAGLHAFLDGLRSEAGAACDAALSPARLAAVRGRIRRRVERATGRRQLRVLRFPGADRPPPNAVTRSRWWLGAAAAAGLIVGLAVGRFGELPGAEGAQGGAGTAISAVTSTERRVDAGSHAGDEQFIEELERALVSPRIPALVAIDAMTPRLHEVAVDFP